MSEVVKNFYMIRYRDNKCDVTVINNLVLSGKLTKEEASEILKQ
jgi:hypothetical protein